MADDDYEIIPKSEILELKREIERIKENPLENTPTDLLSSVNQLNGRIMQLIEVFAEATKELKKEESPRKKDNHLEKRLEELENQNKDIATAMVNFAEKMEGIQKQFSKLMDKISDMNFSSSPFGGFPKPMRAPPSPSPAPSFVPSGSPMQGQPFNSPGQSNGPSLGPSGPGGSFSNPSESHSPSPLSLDKGVGGMPPPPGLEPNLPPNMPPPPTKK